MIYKQTPHTWWLISPKGIANIQNNIYHTTSIKVAYKLGTLVVFIFGLSFGRLKYFFADEKEIVTFECA